MNLKTYFKFYNYRRKVAGSSKDRLPIIDRYVVMTLLAFIAFAVMAVCGSISYLDWHFAKSDAAGKSANRIAELEGAENE